MYGMRQRSSPARSIADPSWAVRLVRTQTGQDRLVPQGPAVGRRRPYDVTILRRTRQSDVPARGSVEEEDPQTRRMRAEAVLLMSKAPLSPRKLAQLAHLADATEARTLVRQLNQIYDALGRALRVEQVAGGYRLLTRPELAPWLARLGHVPAPLRLSTPMMETLAVVAYRQPVSRASTESIRGVACGELLRQLMDRELVRIVGRSEELGRPYLYGTTKRFLQLFGLSNVDALPPIQWKTLQDDPNSEDSPPDDLSTSTKEPVVTTSIAPVLTEPGLEADVSAVAVATLSSDDPTAVSQPVASDDDEEEFYDDDDDDTDEDWDDDDWDDDEDDLDDDEDDDDELDDEDDLEEEDWEEVDDEDDGESDEADDDWDEGEDDEWDDDDEDDLGDDDDDDEEEWD